MSSIIKKLKNYSKDKLITIVFLLAVSIPLIMLIIQLAIEKNFDGNKYLMIMVSVLVLIAFFVPSIIEKKCNIIIPAPIYISFVIFLYCSATLGEIKRFFYIIPWWDTFLHFFNGLILGTLGFSIIYLVLKMEKKISLTPLMAAFLALCFSTTFGVIWEIFEYANDLFLGTNMQKYMLEDGTKLIGQIALNDTMNDIITNFLGTIVSCTIGYIALRKEYKWANKFLITKK